MKRALLLATAVILGCVVFGCGQKKEDTTGNIATTAPVNNSAPEAKNAPVAPSDPSIIMPGGGKKKMPGAAGR